jgi:hypothetical protein
MNLISVHKLQNIVQSIEFYWLNFAAQQKYHALCNSRALELKAKKKGINKARV